MEEVYTWMEENCGWFEQDQSLEEALANKSVSVSSREHGDVGEGTVGREDVMKAIDIISKAQKKFPNHRIHYEICDEWIYVIIEEKSPV
jgi:hypothetical protein